MLCFTQILWRMQDIVSYFVIFVSTFVSYLHHQVSIELLIKVVWFHTYLLFFYRLIAYVLIGYFFTLNDDLFCTILRTYIVKVALFCATLMMRVCMAPFPGYHVEKNERENETKKHWTNNARITWGPIGSATFERRWIAHRPQQYHILSANS